MVRISFIRCANPPTAVARARHLFLAKHFFPQKSLRASEIALSTRVFTQLHWYRTHELDGLVQANATPSLKILILTTARTRRSALASNPMFRILGARLSTRTSRAISDTRTHCANSRNVAQTLQASWWRCLCAWNERRWRWHWRRQFMSPNHAFRHLCTMVNIVRLGG